MIKEPNKETLVHIILVEDDEWYARMIKESLSMLANCEVEWVKTGKEAIQLANKYGTCIVSLDYFLENETGDAVLSQILKINPNNKVIMVSGQEDINTSVQLLRMGAFDYLVKGKDLQDQLWKSIRMAMKELELQNAIDELNSSNTVKINQVQMIGDSKEMDRIRTLISKSCKTDINICLSGETGTGKEVVAALIHRNSNRGNKPYVPVNLSSISPDLFESELFGHEKGAFTGAVSRHIGYFEKAQGGTLFLDEIAELDLKSQVKLLRVLQERNLVRVGGETKIEIDIRLITATHKDLKKEVEEGRFREDLFYRIYGLSIHLPPLRERLTDVKILAQHFVENFCLENKMHLKQMSSEAYKKLLSHGFPGNVRELKSVMELACVMSDGEFIEEEDIAFSSIDENMNLFDSEKTLKEYEIDIVLHYLKKYKKDIGRTADVLSIGKSTIYKMLKDHEINLHRL